MTEPQAPELGRADRPPVWSTLLPFLRLWGVSIASFVGGLLALFVFRRDVPHVRWIVGYLLLLWLLVAVLSQVRQALETRGHRLVVTAADYLIQTLYHGVLLFLLPVYYASSTLGSPNVAFLVLLLAMALVATFDPWWHALVHPRPWVGYVFFVVSLFGALNLALPLVGVPPHLALLGAAWVSGLALTPTVCRARSWPWRRGLIVMAATGVVAAALVWFGRAWIPPVPLFVARANIAWDVASVESLEPATRTIKADELRQRGLIAYTAVYAPAGLRQSIRHVWRREGQVVDIVELSPVYGGRREGFRTYSRKTAFPPDPTGRWVVDIATGSGQLIGRLRFRVVP